MKTAIILSFIPLSIALVALVAAIRERMRDRKEYRAWFESTKQNGEEYEN